MHRKRTTMRIAAVFLVVLLGALTACSVPASDWTNPDSGMPYKDRLVVTEDWKEDPKIISEANGWEYVSAEQNMLDQKREKVLKAKGLKAGSLFGCPDDYVCLYHWIDYQGGRWQQHPNYLDGNCWNFSGSTYTDGYNVNNTSASMVINRYSPALRTWVGMYDWINCNAGGQVWAYDGSGIVLRNNLNDSGAYHKFTSIMTEYVQN